MTSVVVLQARTNSSRLPGKVLLPVGGLPLAVLSAKRAANTGREVVVATSHEATDDVLADFLLEHGLRCYRGSLSNTLERLVKALDDYSDDTLVFRLTADNVFPDGHLLDEIESDFVDRGLDYLCCNGERSGLPYGLSAELTRLGHLREALKSTLSVFDQEHVTPYIRRKFGESYFEKYYGIQKGHLRCTVDCLDDYLDVQRIFFSVADPIKMPALELVERLEGGAGQPLCSSLARKLVLGTVQLGLDYGVANEAGSPDTATANYLIKSAIRNGAAYIDTARAYGNSEEVIGDVLRTGWQGRAKVITKLSPLQELPQTADSGSVKSSVDASIYRSCFSLRTRSLDVLMLHRASHRTDFDGAIWSRLLEHKANGVLSALGVSVQNPAELEDALTDAEVEFIQMPFNVLDWRWDYLIPVIEAVKAKRNLVVHVRSALLQGLLPSNTLAYWKKAGVQSPEQIICWLKEQADVTRQHSVAAFCLNVVRSLSWIDGVVVGMETKGQLVSNVEAFCEPIMAERMIDDVLASRPTVNESVLNPACWGK